MATGYTPTKDTTNFAKFSWITVEVCRDALFDIVSLEIAPVDIPKEIKANPHKVKLFPEQKKSICNKAGGAAPNKEDFDIPSLYTILRNLCSGIPPPTRGWFDNTLQNHPFPADVRVSDDVERLRNKRNALFGHIKRAQMSDFDFQKEISEIKQILTRLDGHLGSQRVKHVTSIEMCCMDPEMEQTYILEVEEQQKRDTETRELVEIEKKNVSEIRQKFEKLKMSHDEETTRHEQTRRDVVHTKKALKDFKEDQTTTRRSLVKLEEKQREEKTLHEQTRDDQKKTKKVLMELQEKLQEKQMQHKAEHKQTCEAIIETKNSVRELRAQHLKSEEQFKLVRGKQESIVEQLKAQKLKTEDDRGLLQAIQLQQAEVKADLTALKEDQSTKIQEADKPKLQETKEHLRQSYHEFETLKVSIVPTSHDVPLSEVFTKVVIREDLENSRYQGRQSTVTTEQYHEPGQKSDKSNKEMESYRDLFYKDEVLQKNIYLLGQAGSGKTTFCKHLVDVWCKSPIKAPFRNIEEITNFDYVFLVSCRYAESSDTILKMICDQLFDSETEYLYPTVRYVLNRKPEKCLILVDGLDEWAGSPSKSTGARTPCGLPNRKGLENCVVLTTSRPWRIEALRQGKGKLHRVLEIQGLTDRGLKELSLNLLSALNTPNPSETLKKFMADVEAAEMTEIVQTPLMLIIVLTIWLADRKLDKSLSVNFSGMIECLIQRAEGLSGRSNDTNRLADISQLPKLKSEWAKQTRPLPHCFMNMDFCNQFAPLIYKLANFAFDSLFHEIKENALVFSMEALERVFKKTELDICLKIGILSLTSAPVKSVKRVSKVSFFHKSIQEFLAATALVSYDSRTLLTVFKSHCRSLTDVLDYSKVILFLCGPSPSKGRELWKCICDVISADPLVQEYRQAIEPMVGCKLIRSPDSTLKSVLRLQHLALCCFAETVHSQLDKSDRNAGFFTVIPDIYIGWTKSGDFCDLVCCHAFANPSEVRSLFVEGLAEVTSLENDLHKLFNLERLHIEVQFMTSFQQTSRLCSAISKLKSLRSLSLFHCWYDTESDYQLSLNLPQLRNVSLCAGTTLRLHLTLPITLTTLCLCNVELSHQSLVSLCSLVRSTSTLQVLYIDGIQCFDCESGVCRHDFELSKHLQLEQLVLRDVLCIQTVTISPDMTRLRKIDIFDIQMSRGAWGNFLHSLPRPAHGLTVRLRTCGIDADSVKYIKHHFTVTRRNSTLDRIDFQSDVSP